jgi:hypothetical protein
MLTMTWIKHNSDCYACFSELLNRVIKTDMKYTVKYLFNK